MSLNLDQSTGQCCVVIGPNEVSNCRSNTPDVPVVALVDAALPAEAILAQAAGADVVLPVSDLEFAALGQIPDLALAVSAAGTIAKRRSELARSSRQVGHDLAGAFNVIGLAAEVGAKGAVEPGEAFAQIAALAKGAGGDAWRAGRADRSLRRSLAAVDVIRVVGSAATAGHDVEVVTPPGELWVFADEPQLTAAIDELICNARGAGAKRIVVEVSADRQADDQHQGDRQTVSIVVTDDGSGITTDQGETIGEPYNSSSSGRLGLGLATIAEFAADIGGSFALDHGGESAGATARLSLRAVGGHGGDIGAHIDRVDQATAQADILEGVVRHAPLAESLDAIVTAIENQLPGTTCSVLLLNDGRSLHHGAGAKLPAAYRQAIDGLAIGRGQGSCGTAAYIGRPVVATDVTTDKNWVDFRDVAIEHGLRSCWSTPIVAAEGGEVLGTFAVYKASVWRPGEAATKLVQRFTYLAAVAIEHHRLFEAVAESESRFRSAFEGASAGLALVQLDGTLLKINPSLSTMVARSESALVSSNLLDLVHPDWHEEILAAWGLLAQGQVAGPNPQPIIEVPLAAAPNGEQVWVSLSTSIIAAAGEWNFYVEVRDITVSRRHLAEQRAREAAEAANRAKNDFLALVSHELRTPLNAILGFAQVMQLTDLELDEEQRADGVEQIVRAGEHLRDLIDQLLDLSRIEAGQLSVKTEDVDTAKVIHEALDLVGPLAMSRNISLINDRRLADRPHVIADRRCLRQVLINLLGNAVKYTPADGRVAVEVHDVDGGYVRITVNDTGPGIAPESIDELFRPFHRLEPDNDARSEGTGLGLALTERLMAEMGGAIGVDSVVGVGSSFWVEFPSATNGAEATNPADFPAIESPQAADAEHHAGVLLYIEDDEGCVGVMQTALVSRPLIELRNARDAAEGAKHLMAGDVDLVLLDIGLPDRCGWDLLCDIRAAAPDLPVVVLTAGAEPISATAPYHDRLLTKPVDIAEALRAIDLILARSPSRHDIG